jgi:DNA-binding transcriptional MerR regulator
MSEGTAEGAALRIGELARRVGTTPRTIRYYEELGLLGEAAMRPAGGHRSYTETDVANLTELIRLRELLGLSLEELRRMRGAEEARALLRAELAAGVADSVRERELLNEALGHLDAQLALVRRRAAELGALEADLAGIRERVLARLAALESQPPSQRM